MAADSARGSALAAAFLVGVGEVESGRRGVDRTCYHRGMMDEQQVVDSAVEGLRTGLGDDLLSVVVYGSRARRTARPDSDWDVLVIARSLPARVLARHVLLKRMLPPAVRGKVAIYSLTQEELAAAWPPPALHLDIGVDGVASFDPTGLASEWMTAIRTEIDAQGLVRVDTPFGMHWRRASAASTVSA